jgi:TRAP-type C4-dicarboxylate transport system permease small subunit
MTRATSVLGRVRQVLFAVAKAAWLIAAVGIFLTMLVICYDVLARYVLNQPSEWVFQLVSSGLLAITFLSLPYLYAKDDHIAVDLVYDYLPRPVRVGASWLTRVVAVVFGLVVGWYGVDLVRSAAAAGLQTSGAFSIPVSWVSAPMAVGGLLLALVALVAPAPAVDVDHHSKEGVA